MVAVILAAGFSTRFGDNKLLAKLNGKPVIKCVSDTVQKCPFDKVLLVYHSPEVAKAVEGSSIKTVFNPLSAQGQSTSVKAGVMAAAATDAYMFFPGDQPFIDESTVISLQKAYYEGRGLIIAPTYNGKRGSPVIFDEYFKTALLSITGDTGGKTVIEANQEKLYEVPMENTAAGLDIDTREDYKKYGGEC